MSNQQAIASVISSLNVKRNRLEAKKMSEKKKITLATKRDDLNSVPTSNKVAGEKELDLQSCASTMARMCL